MKVSIHHPPIAAVASTKQNSLGVAPVMLVELGRVDCLGIGRTVDDPRASHQVGEGHLVNRGSLCDEMQWCIHVRAGVRGHQVRRQSQFVALVETAEKFEFRLSVARIRGRRGWIKRCGDIDPARAGDTAVAPAVSLLAEVRKDGHERSGYGENEQVLRHQSVSFEPASKKLSMPGFRWNLLLRLLNQAAGGVFLNQLLLLLSLQLCNRLLFALAVFLSTEAK